MNKNLRKITVSAVLAALICVATMVVQIPSPLGGYINLGDSVILLTAFLLPSGYGFLAAAIGSALADVLLSYVMYAPATFIIKGAIVLAANGVFKLLSKKMPAVASRILAFVCGEFVMVAGYYVFEGFLYGFGASLVNILPNAVQGVAGIILGSLLVGIFKKYNIQRFVLK